MSFLRTCELSFGRSSVPSSHKVLTVSVQRLLPASRPLDDPKPCELVKDWKGRLSGEERDVSDERNEHYNNLHNLEETSDGWIPGMSLPSVSMTSQGCVVVWSFQVFARAERDTDERLPKQAKGRDN